MRHSRLSLLCLALLLLTLVVPVAAQTDAQAVPRFEPSACSFASIAGQNPTCGFLVVPEDRSDPANNKTIKLAVAVFKTTNLDAQAEPIIYLDGGPGGSTLELVQYQFEPLFAPLLTNNDLILFDQRGVGQSQPALDCPEITAFTFATLNEVMTTDDYVQRYAETSIACGEHLKSEGINLAAYNSAQSAADVRDLWQTLGYPGANLLGISYGTRLALTVMRDQPQGIRSVVIDSVVPLQESGFNPALSAQRALNELFAACKADLACDSAYPNLEQVFYSTVKALDAKPAHIQIPTINKGIVEGAIDGDTFVGLMFNALYSDSLIGDLPGAIYAAQGGQFDFLTQLAFLQLFQLDFISLGMYYSVNCSEEYPFDTPQSINAILSETSEGLRGFARRGMIDPKLFSVCQAWGTKTPAPLENQPVQSNIPTLVLSGQFDPVTPPQYGAEVHANLPNSYFYTFPGLAHGVTPANDCTKGIVIGFFANPTQAPDTACIASLKAPVFVAGAVSVADLPPITLEPFDNTLLGFSSVRPQGWTDQTMGILSRGQDAADQTIFTQQAMPGADKQLAIQTFMKLLGGDGGVMTADDTLEANGLTWDLYRATVVGFPLDIAAAQGEGKVFIVLLVSNPEERDALFQVLFLPTLQAFKPL